MWPERDASENTFSNRSDLSKRCKLILFKTITIFFCQIIRVTHRSLISPSSMDSFQARFFNQLQRCMLETMEIAKKKIRLNAIVNWA